MNSEKVLCSVKLFLFSLCFSVSAFAQSDQMDGHFLQLGIDYVQPVRPGLDNYLKAFSDTFHFTNEFKLDKGYGLTIGFMSHKNAAEFSAGGDLLYSSDFKKADTVSGKIRTTDINLFFGLDIFPVRWFYVGGHFMICNESEKFIAGNSIDDGKLETPDASFAGIFNGYSVGAKAIAGFNFNVSPDDKDNTYLRLSAFYQLGTHYNFYNTFEKRLKNYEGNKKTSETLMGVSLAMVFKT